MTTVLNNNKLERLDYIDVAKGIGIILVVIAHHLLGAEMIRGYINSFHMPLFFIISGYLYAHKKEWNRPLKSIVIKKAKSLLYPYLTFGIIIIVWHFVYYDIIFKNSVPEWGTIKVVIYFLSTYGYHALWFLPCLFLSSIIYIIIRKHRIHHFVCLPISVLISLPFINDFFNSNDFTQYIYRLFIAVTFIYFGNLLYDLCKKEKIVYFLAFIISLSLSIASVICYIFFSDHFPIVNIAVGNIGNCLFFYLFALSNSVSILFICERLIRQNAFLSFWGKNSLIVMAIHMDITIEICWLVYNKIPIDFGNTINSIIVVLLEFVLLFAIIKLINRFLPFMIKIPIKKHNNTH